MNQKKTCIVMKKMSLKAAVVVSVLLAAGPLAAQETASPMVPPKAPLHTPDDVRQAWACVAGGSAGTAAAVAAGAENLVNVVAGGVVAPNNRAVMIVGLAGVVFTTFCTLGQQLLPLVDYYAPWGATTPPTASETAGAAGRGAPEHAPLTSSYESAKIPAVFVDEIALARF